MFFAILRKTLAKTSHEDLIGILRAVGKFVDDTRDIVTAEDLINGLEDGNQAGSNDEGSEEVIDSGSGDRSTVDRSGLDNRPSWGGEVNPSEASPLDMASPDEVFESIGED